MLYKPSLALEFLANIQTQHSELTLILAKLVSLSQNEEQYIIQLNYLISYSSDHFDTEEKIMQYFDYPKLITHKQQHLEFIKSTKQILTYLIEGKLTYLNDASQFVKQWFDEHNLSYDIEFENFLSKKV